MISVMVTLIISIKIEHVAVGIVLFVFGFDSSEHV